MRFLSSLALVPIAAVAGLIARAPAGGQSVENPDNEPAYTETTSGNQVPKSGILTGVGPPEAENRFFDWDESCTDPDDRRAIMTTFHNIQPLALTGRGQATALIEALARHNGNAAQKKRFIVQEDPAFTQMFKAREASLPVVEQAFQSVLDNIKDRNRRTPQPPALRFICNKNDHVKYNDGPLVCKNADNKPDSEAVTFVPNGGFIEDKYNFQTSSSIVFCPAFFAKPSLAAVGDAATIMLDQADCKERILLHEYLHLPWTMDMAGVKAEDDPVGFEYAAIYAANRDWKKQRQAPDLFAWYALYSYLNNFGEGCKRDAWPTTKVQKPIRL